MNLGNYKVPERVKEKTTSERAELLRLFLEKVNLARVGSKYKPLNARALAIKLSHLKTHPDLYFFFKRCTQATNFSQCFWGSLKTKTHDPQNYT